MGRPAARSYCVDEVARLLAVPADRVQRVLDAGAPSFFAGAFRDRDGIWRIPERALRGLLGCGLPQLLTVAEFAALVGFSRQWIYQLAAAGVIESRRVLGHVRIPATAYWTLPAEVPAGTTPPRPDFFAGKEEAAA